VKVTEPSVPVAENTRRTAVSKKLKRLFKERTFILNVQDR